MARTIEYFDEPPEISSADTLAQFTETSGRDAFPCRRTFVRKVDRDTGKSEPGPLATMVRRGDRTGLLLELLLLTKASGGEFNVALPAQAWARAIGMELPDSASARSTVSKALRRLKENYHLIEKSRSGRWADVKLLDESGDGHPYTRPKGTEGDVYFNVPHEFWLDSPAGHQDPWFRTLSLPGIAVLLIAHWYMDNFELPHETGSERFGISADSIGRGLDELRGLGALDAKKRYRAELKSPAGYTGVLLYHRLPPFDSVKSARSSRDKKEG